METQINTSWAAGLCAENKALKARVAELEAYKPDDPPSHLQMIRIALKDAAEARDAAKADLDDVISQASLLVGTVPGSAKEAMAGAIGCARQLAKGESEQRIRAEEAEFKWRDANYEIAQQAIVLEDVTGRADAADVRVAGLEHSLADAMEQIEAIQGSNATHMARVAELEVRERWVEGMCLDWTVELDKAKARVVALEGELAREVKCHEAAGHEAERHASRVTELETAITTLRQYADELVKRVQVAEAR